MINYPKKRVKQAESLAKKQQADLIKYNLKQAEAEYKDMPYHAITSDDLELVADIIDNHGGIKHFVNDIVIDLKKGNITPREFCNKVAKGKRLYTMLKSKILIDKMFDWKEEEEMVNYIYQTGPRLYKLGYKYTYNAYPNGDGVWLVHSKVKLSKAEEVNP
jgi:hypothetical protein